MILNEFDALRRGRELGDSLGSFAHCVFREFTRQHETDRRLDFPTAQSGFLVVRGQLSRFSRNAFKDIINKGIHDGHALFGNARIGVDLFQHLVNVRRIRLDALFGLGAFRSGSGRFLGGRRLGGLLGRSLGHGCKEV
jgi:hypothetical protein